MSPSNLESRFQTLHEIVRAARMNLAPGPWDYLAGGTETETTLRRNRRALDSLAFRPRVLRDVSKIDTSSTLFGRPVRIPAPSRASSRAAAPPPRRRPRSSTCRRC